MVARSLYGFAVTLTMAAIILFNGCKRDLDVLTPAPFPKDAEIFTDQFGPSVQYQAFGDSKLDAISISTDVKYSGTSSIKVTVPNDGDKWSTYSYAGGALVSAGGRDLTGYNAVTFWAKSSVEATSKLIIGIGNDNTGTSKYTSQQSNLSLHTIWTKYTFPIPNPAKLTKEKGLFFFAASNVSGAGYDFWMDDIKYESLGTLAYPRFSVTAKTVEKVAGDTLHMDAPTIIYNLDGSDVSVSATAACLNYSSSDSSIATVDGDGIVTAIGAGSASITSKLGTYEAAGKVTITAKADLGPATPAPTPTASADSVISLFSDKYTNRTIDTWAATWGTGKAYDTTISGNNVKIYKNLGYAGIDFSNHQVDATNMTHLHLDMWTTYSTASPATFKIKLVDFGIDGKSGGGDDNEQELSYSATSTPALKTGSWVSFDIPLSDFAFTSQANLAQLIISGSLKTVWIDNIYFYQGKGTVLTVPKTAAPTPSAAAADVISLFSDGYSNRSVDNDVWAAYWQYSTSVVVNKTIAGNSVKLYTNLNFAGIEFTTTNMIDASAMNYFHIDIWTPNSNALPSKFLIKLVDFGANGVYDAAGGDDSSYELTYNLLSTPSLKTGTWISFDIPFTSFTGLKSRSHLAQLVLSGAGDIKTVWVDNIYFHK